jgi:single-strand DNA-binding protein
MSNRAILLGNVGKDPETRHAAGGDKIVTFSLATSESWKDMATGERKETTEWHTIVIFNQALAGIAEQYVKKGTKLYIEAKIKTRKWQDRDGKDRWSTEIVIDRFDGKLELVGQPQGAKRDEHGYGTTRSRDDDPPASAPASRRELDDDIPF